MDGYNFSVSDSWSVENDLPNGESISYNGRDYTPEFTTEQVSYYILSHANSSFIFESRENMLRLDNVLLIHIRFFFCRFFNVEKKC